MYLFIYMWDTFRQIHLDKCWQSLRKYLNELASNKGTLNV